jgi:hypothetical protein
MTNLGDIPVDPNDEFALDRVLLPMFRSQDIIVVTNYLIDPAGFNLKEVPGKPYKIFKPVFSAEQRRLVDVLSPDDRAIYFHMLAVRNEAADLIREEYLFIRAYRVGHTLKMETIAVVVEARVKGGCHVFDEDGRIGGDGKGRWYGVLCPAEAEAELVADPQSRGS